MELFQSPNIEILGIAVAVAAIGAVSAYIYLSKKPKGPVEFAAVGVSIAVFNQVSRIAFFPLVSITTSFVAEEDATSKIRSIEEQETDNMEKALPKSSKMKESSTQAEWDLGGFPAWLLAIEPALRLRSSDPAFLALGWFLLTFY